MAIHSGQSSKSMKELIDAVKKEPGKHAYASAGVGSTPHLQGEMFKAAYGLDMVHMPFAGGAPALQSAVGGHTPIVIAALAPAISLVKGGELRALAIIGPKRVSALPEVPTMTEAGLPGRETETILLALAPAGTPKEIVERLVRRDRQGRCVARCRAETGCARFLANGNHSRTRRAARMKRRTGHVGQGDQGRKDPAIGGSLGRVSISVHSRRKRGIAGIAELWVARFREGTNG